MRIAARVMCGVLAIAGVSRAAVEERIGGWVLSCGGTDACVLRAARRFVDKAGITGDLEVQALGDRLVPVLALRGLSGEVLIAAAMAGKADAWLRFDDGPREALNCSATGSAFVCSPGDDAAGKLAAELPSARSVTVRVSVSVAGMKPVPVVDKSLGLSGTAEALGRLRAVGPAAVAGGSVAGLVAQSPAGLLGIADRALKAAGYPNGIADLQALLAKYRGK